MKWFLTINLIYWLVWQQHMAITLIRDLFTFSRKKMIKSHYPLDTVFVKKQYRYFLFCKDYFFFYKDLPEFLKDFLHKILEFLYILQEQWCNRFLLQQVSNNHTNSVISIYLHLTVALILWQYFKYKKFHCKINILIFYIMK